MQFSLKGVLKFLFPEWQIIEAVERNGFLRCRRRPVQSGSSGRNFPRAVQPPASGNPSYGYPGSPGMTGSGHVFSRAVQQENRMQTSRPEVGQLDQQGQAAVFQHKGAADLKDRDYVSLFNDARTELARTIIGQDTYLDGLTDAFKRPFVVGSDPGKPRNIILITGPSGSGKHKSLQQMTLLLHDSKLFHYDTAPRIDLSKYNGQADAGLFLSDLYAVLYGASDLAVFDNIEKSAPLVLSAIIDLCAHGSYELSSRYALSNNMLVEATGALTENPIRALQANGKYFVFASRSSQRDIANACGPVFMGHVSDVLVTEDFSDQALHGIAAAILRQIIRKSRENLHIKLTCSDSAATRLQTSFNYNKGIHSLNEYAALNIYNPLAELKMQGELPDSAEVFLSASDSGFVAWCGDQPLQLADYASPSMPVDLEEARRELQEVVGLQEVKRFVYNLEASIKQQQEREKAGLPGARVSMHMVFTGNPGTGKTTVARIIARYLKALGLLSGGQLVEVTRADMVGAFMGSTAGLTTRVIQSALGGVLFIDEAYTLCRDKFDPYGREAVDTLVKGIEDHRDELVVIMAGYVKEMDEFMNTNPGLKSRFPYTVHFNDYTVPELLQISLSTAGRQGYRIAPDCHEDLMREFERQQIPGRNDSGNGRMVRNLIEAAVIRQAQRLLSDSGQEPDLLIMEDFGFADYSHFDMEASLAAIIGLDSVKDFIRTQYKQLQALEKRRSAGITVELNQSLNMIFSGNPGTGKTTMARVVASMLRDMGLLKKGHLVETDRSGLVAEYIGQTSAKTEAVFRSAIGGVLFIDEAYALANESIGYGREALDTLVKLIEDYRGDIVVILAGYRKEMADFLKSNAGLESRFPLRIDFPDYSVDELYDIMLQMIEKSGFRLDEAAAGLLYQQLQNMHRQSSAASGNARMVRNYLEEIIRNQSTRIVDSETPPADMNLITAPDLESLKKSQDFDLDGELDRIVGLEEVKDFIRSLNARLRIQNERKKMGLPIDDSPTLHMVFKGNPGTGKTMVARTIARVLYNIGIVKTDTLIETDRSELVAGFVGQTAIKTRTRIMEALDGVLFIDEAYTLYQMQGDNFGKEAIDTIVKVMDDYRDRIVFIFAGYSDDMDRFMEANAGLKSRCPNIVQFADYDTEQLMSIAMHLFHDKGYVLDEEAQGSLRVVLARARRQAHFGNGRYVRNLFEKAVSNQAMRLHQRSELARSDLVGITAGDIEGA